jgi:hypothetical protein
LVLAYSGLLSKKKIIAFDRCFYFEKKSSRFVSKKATTYNLAGFDLTTHSSSLLGKGCQVVYLHSKVIYLGIYVWQGLGMENVGKFYGHL